MKSPREESELRTEFLATESPRSLLIFNAVFALIYFVTLAVFFPEGNPVLFWLLIAGEVFHIWQVGTFLHTVWRTDYEAPQNARLVPAVDVFITTAGEPIDIVEETVRAVTSLQYRGSVTTYILNDGYVAKKDNWRDAEDLAVRTTTPERPVYCITRTVPGGAKAGNINNALRYSTAPLIAIFDADHVPHADFLQKTVRYFVDASVGFVQTPQFYKNYAHNYLTRSSWEQQELFYGAICRGKNRLNAATMCGTNMLISRHALVDVGGMCTESIAEDFLTGLFMHQKGYRSVYVPEVLAEGLATEDLLTYSKQQFRWARGALDVMFRYNPLFMRGLSFDQRLQYLASSSFYLSGLVVLIDIFLPLVFLYTGQVPIRASGMLLAAVFLPYIFITLYMIQRVSNFTFTYPSLALSMSSFHIHIQAFLSAITRQRAAFSISSKVQIEGNQLSLAAPHVAYIGAAAIGIIIALVREGVSSAFINNTAWVALNVVVFLPFIRSAFPAKRTDALPESMHPSLVEATLPQNVYGRVGG